MPGTGRRGRCAGRRAVRCRWRHAGVLAVMCRARSRLCRRAEVESRQPCGCGHGATTCGASGRACGVPRVQRRSEHRVARLDVLVPRGHVGLADDHRTCGTQSSYRLCVLVGHVVLEIGPTTDGPQAGGLVAVLRRDRQAVQRAEVRPARALRVGIPGGLEHRRVAGEHVLDRRCSPPRPRAFDERAAKRVRTFPYGEVKRAATTAPGTEHLGWPEAFPPAGASRRAWAGSDGGRAPCESPPRSRHPCCARRRRRLLWPGGPSGSRDRRVIPTPMAGPS